MIKAQFKSYGSYVTDSVYQWDLNQKLSISGLVMSSAPVIAYSSKAVKKAIIVQSKIVDGVINCDIPNALLQFDNDITAHLCSLENKQYKAVEKMIIPVIKRAMPADYLFTDNVPILTYEAIEADIQHFYNLGKSYTDSAKSEIDIERKRIDNLVKDTTDNVVEYKADNFLMSCKSDAQASTTETALNVFKNISSKSENLGNFITISSGSKTQIKKSGLYSFDCKVQVTGVNASTGRQYARLKINDVQKNEYMISLVGETDEEFTNFIVSLNEGDTISFTGESDFDDTWITLYTTIHILDYDGKVKIPDITKEVSDIRIGVDNTVYDTAGQAVREQLKKKDNEISSLKEDLAYKINSRLTPIQFETVLGYYKANEFVTGKKEWGARLMRVQCKKGDKYLYHGYCDNVNGVSFLDSEFHIIRQISVPKNKEFEMDVIAIDNASYIDFYSGNIAMKTYVLKYNREDTINNDVGEIFVDASSQFSVIDDKYFNPLKNEYVYGVNMKLKEITPENDTVFKFSFTQNQHATAYVDDFCIVTSNNYVNGTEVFHENIIVFVPKGKTLRINDFNSNVYVSKFEKLVPITEEYINEKIPDVPKTVDTVTDGESNPVSSNAVYQAIKTNVAHVSTGLPYIAVASSEAPTTIKSVCQYVCDGTNDEIEIQNAINSLGSTGGKVFLTKGKFFISQPIETGNTLIELCGEGALLDLREDTLNSPDRGGTILQAVGNTDLLHIGGAKGTTVHDIAFFGYGRNKVDNTSYGIRFTGYADTDRIYNCGFTNCAVAIGADIQTDVLYIHNLSVQRNKVGICLYRSDAEVHDCLFCENIGMENVSWDNKTYNINCADICVKDGGSKIYNNTFRRSGMCYDIYNVYGNESKLESDVVNPISSVVLLGVAKILSNYFYDQIYANCIRVMSKPDFIYIEGNSFTKWGRAELEDESKKAAICFEKGSVFGTVMNNRFYSDSNTDKFTDKYAIYEVSIGNDNNYWSYSNTYANNFIGNLTGETDNKCVIVGTSVNNKFINNIIAEKYKDTAVVN